MGRRGARGSARGQKSTGIENCSTAAPQAAGWTARGVVSKQQEGLVSWFLLGAAVGPPASASPGYFIKRKKKKSLAGETRIFWGEEVKQITKK